MPLRSVGFQEIRGVGIFILLAASVSGAYAQGRADADTTLSLPLLTITDLPGERTGYSVWRADTLPAQSVISLSERMQWEVPVAIRINAPGGLSTVSARGAGPARTAIFWEGINLQSPMNGVVDIALVPLWPGDQVEVRYGGQSAAQNNGILGGQIRLVREEAPAGAGWSWSGGGELGGFGQTVVQAGLGYDKTRFQSHIRAAWQQAENDFPFKNTALLGQPKVRQQNNALHRMDIQQFNRFILNEQHSMSSAFWYQQAYREIPPAMTSAPEDTWQQDQAFRAVIGWNSLPDSIHAWQHRLALQDESLVFALSGDRDTSRFRNLIAQSSFATHPSGSLTLRTGLLSRLNQAVADGYSDSTGWTNQFRIAGWASAGYRWPAFHINVLLRQEWAQAQGFPFTWTIGGLWNPGKPFGIRAHLSRNYNLPTFNDRFWLNLGDPDLEPESGYSSDLGILWEKNGMMAELTGFYLMLDDWILWQPGTDGLFRPGNLREVRSRGVELQLRKSFRFLKNRWQFRMHYQYCHTTNTAVYDSNTTALFKVLPYTPMHNAAFSVHWSKDRFSASYLHQFTGKQFTTSDNSREIPGFSTGNLLAQFRLRLSSHTLFLTGRVENCWNTAYQILAYRPMPGRNWHLGLHWSFK
ncbi:MAG: TonB-dependent receptor [Bacteroidetes bacterium]|nr:MAG: TonB-dependent receptor [Bacteroidota bacterium]